MTQNSDKKGCLGKFFLLVVIFFFIVDMLAANIFSRAIFGPIRLVLFSSTFDDTYFADSKWPVEGGIPVKVEAEIVYKGKKYNAQRMIRCHKNKSLGGSVNWVRQLRDMAMEFDDGSGILIKGMPGGCRIKHGRIVPKPLDPLFYSYLYFDNLSRPTYMEDVSRISSSVANIAIAPGGSLFLPRKFNFTFSYPTSKNITYSSGKEKDVYGWALGDRPSSFTPRRIYSSVSGLIYLKMQWRKNSRISELISRTSKPIIIPEFLLKGLPGWLEKAGGSEDDLAQFFKKFKLMPPGNTDFDNFNRFSFRLVENNTWMPDFSSIGINKYYFRGCSDNTEKCAGSIVDDTRFEADFIRIGDLTLRTDSKDGIYFPKLQIILRPILKNILSIPQE